MSIKPTQFRFLIGLLLKDFDKAHGSQFYSINAVEQLIFTAAHETHCGRFLWQDDGEPGIERKLAYGAYQMEPIGYKQASLYLQRHHPTYRVPPRRHLVWDLRAATIAARAYYASWIDPLPEAYDVPGMAEYYKRIWNTEKGKATIDTAIENYYRYAVERPI